LHKELKNQTIMGLIEVEIELVNAIDSGLHKRRMIGEEEIRRMPVQVLVDTGAIMLCINETIRDYLGLDKIAGKRISRLADGTRIELEVVGPVEVHYMNRICITDALVLPGDAEPLLGAIPMEELDVVAHPARQTLEPAHPEGQVMMLK
jgi:clan AA aspartic protease